MNYDAITKRLLERAREKIGNEEHWTQGELARNMYHSWVHPVNAAAVCWCPSGAIRWAANTDIDLYLDKDKVAFHVKLCIDHLGKHIRHDSYAYDNVDASKGINVYFNPVERWNDNRNRKHHEVLDLFDRAIASI